MKSSAREPGGVEQDQPHVGGAVAVEVDQDVHVVAAPLGAHLPGGSPTPGAEKAAHEAQRLVAARVGVAVEAGEVDAVPGRLAAAAAGVEPGDPVGLGAGPTPLSERAR